MVRIHGHRGCRSLLPENSIEGVKAAFASGAFAVEIDVRLTKDLDFAVVHDEVLQPSYYHIQQPVQIAQTTLDEVRKISFGEVLHPDFLEQKAVRVQIPALSDVVSRFSEATHLFNVEVKVEEEAEELTAEAFEMWMEQEDYLPFRLQSFNLTFLELLHESKAHSAMHWLIEKPEQLQGSWPEWLEGIAIESSLITDEVVQKAREKKLTLSAWTVNTLEEAERLIQCGVSEIISDNPALLIQNLDRSN